MLKQSTEWLMKRGAILKGQQISAVRYALDGVTEVIVQDLLEYYVSQITDIKGKEIAREIKDTVSRIL